MVAVKHTSSLVAGHHHCHPFRNSGIDEIPDGGSAEIVTQHPRNFLPSIAVLPLDVDRIMSIIKVPPQLEAANIRCFSASNRFIG